MTKRLNVVGSTLRSRLLKEKVALVWLFRVQSFRARFWEALEAGRLKPVMDRTFDIRDVEAAHERMKTNLNIGKMVLRIT